MNKAHETERIRQRYQRRKQDGVAERYRPVKEVPLAARQERERALARLFRRLESSIASVGKLRVLEIGCGTGDNLLELIRLGFRPCNLVANELLPDSLQIARSRLPAKVEVYGGDALDLEFEPGTFDIVYQSTVFTSILDSDFRARLAETCWHWIRPGGGVLWYDFAWDNPRNPDVRGIPLRGIRELFPQGYIYHRRIILAPPIARLLTRIHPAMYPVANLLPWLRTHILAWIQKP